VSTLGEKLREHRHVGPGHPVKAHEMPKCN
jgi:hypothetical protein